jgi:hypothetical protein
MLGVFRSFEPRRLNYKCSSRSAILRFLADASSIELRKSARSDLALAERHAEVRASALAIGRPIEFCCE